MMKKSSSTPPVRQASQKSSSQMPGFVSPVYLVMLVGGWKWCSPDALAKGPWPWALRAGALVIWPVIAPRSHFTASLDGSARVRVACCRMADVVVVLGLTPVANDAKSVLVWSVWSSRLVGLWRGYRTSSQA